MGRDPEYLAFFRRVAPAMADAEEPSLERRREGFRRSMAYAPRPAMAAVEDLTLPGADGPLRARLLVPPAAGDDALVYVHGGGLRLGDLDDSEPVARVIAEATGCRVLEIEHRPANPVPRDPACLRRLLSPSMGA